MRTTIVTNDGDDMNCMRVDGVESVCIGRRGLLMLDLFIYIANGNIKKIQ
jgi:hypothetical protein